ncbi:MAG TPA: POTRA domain-containing protein [Vicinamibacterales bacterium]|nr:POTRA domain-containing protein [Vicinamibacterales bacterium]
MPAVRRTLVVLVLMLSGAIGAPGTLAAQVAVAASAYVGENVTAVTVTVEGRPTIEPGLLGGIQTAVGRPLAMADVRETITHLFSLGRFADVQVEADRAATGGIALRFELKPIHTVTRVEFRGELGLGESALRGHMSERFGAAPPLTRAADVAAALTQLYADRGYLSASVTPAPPVIQHDPDRATLVFDIASGPRTTIARSTVTGHPLSSAADIQSRLQIRPGQPYQPGELRERLESLLTSMRRRSYYEATASVAAPSFNADRTEVDLTVDVQPGPLVTVTYAGDPLPKANLDELVPVEREGSVDQDLLEDSARRIEDFLRQQGYWKAQVNPPARREEDGRLSLVFTVSRGDLYRIAPAGVEVTGSRAISPEEIRPLVRMAPGEPFVASRLGAAENAIRQLYRTRGFATAEIASAVNESGPGLVTPVITIKEGPRVLVGGVTLTGNATVAEERLRAVLSLTRDQPYYGPAVIRDRDAIYAFYLDEGYAAAEVSATPVTASVTPDLARADVTFRIVEGPQTIIEHIFVTGNLRTRESIIRRELQFEEGRPLGLAALTESRRRLSALGLFRRIQISAVAHGDPRVRDVVVAVEEAPQTTIGYGGGLQLDRVLKSVNGVPDERYELAPRGFFEVGRRNLGGSNRSLNLYSRLSLRPNQNTDSDNPFGFSEYRLVGTYRQPRALLGYGELTSTAAVEQGVRTGFNFIRKGFNSDVAYRVSPVVRSSARYTFGTTRIVDNVIDEEGEQLTVDRAFPQVRLSTVSAALSRDTRDDPLEPQRGTFLAFDATIAGRAIGSEVGFTKAFLQGFVYRNLGRPNLVFAGGARVGLARAFVRQVTIVDENGTPQVEQVRDLPASERFYTGGESTIRGYALDSVGAPATLTPSGFPRGGDAEIVLNAELRLPIRGAVGGVVFVDGGNVFARASDLDLSQLRGSVGFGARYRSPIGPIRLDMGFKLDRRLIGTALEPRYAVHFSIGQAF